MMFHMSGSSGNSNTAVSHAQGISDEGSDDTDDGQLACQAARDECVMLNGEEKLDP